MDAEISENRFRSVWLIHPNITNFPVAQLYKLANTLALENDHDYLQHSLSDNWLRVMNVTEISNEDIVMTETRTHGQSSN